MRFTRYFALFITFFVVTSCAYNDIDILAPSAPAGSGAVTICGRITSFGDHSVTTRAGKTNEESYSSSMAMAIFPIDETNPANPTLGNCISYIHLQGSNVNFTIDRAQLREEYGDIYDDMPFALYLFANMPELPANMAGLEAKGLDSLKSFMQLAYQNSGIRRPQKGFPMIGSLGDYITPGADGKRFVLIPTSGEDANLRILLPQVDDEPSDYIPIPLKALYAKFSFIISLEPDQHIQNGATPTFTLENYTLKNVPKVVYADSVKNRETSVLDGEITTSVGTSVTEGGELKFDFYLPERFLTPNTSAEEYGYPLGKISAEGNGYSNVRDEDKKYCQRFKPDLVKDQDATYITLSGHYSDHQGHSWKVDYDIYLGEDNYGNFDFKRNINYINSVVIRGLSASNDQGQTDYGPFIDHRVTVTRSLPIIINLHRETLLDSHFEVRPLRVRHPSGARTGATVTVEILDSLGKSESESDRFPNWVRMEHNNGTGSATTTHLASGKRKYFTTNLVSNTLADSTKITAPLNGTNQETFWIYVDQCDEGAPLNNPNQVRKAKIKVTYDADGDPDTENEELVYTICQHLLYPVRTIRNGAGEDGDTVTYYIEYEEEYLHNFDSEDSYGFTEEAGMEWGLNGIQLSNKHNAFYAEPTKQGLWDEISLEEQANVLITALSNIGVKPKYDFYLSRDNVNSKLTIRNFDGYQMNFDIATYLKDAYSSHQGEYASGDAQINGITLEEQPKSAFAYCYNRNKRNENGTVDSQEWYLPAIDEIEDIMEFAYGDFDTEFQGNMYWSCQPAYIPSQMHFNRYVWAIYKWEDSADASEWLYGGEIDINGEFYTDDTANARATKAKRDAGGYATPPNSGANLYRKYTNGIFRLSRTNVSGNKTAEMGKITYEDSDYKNPIIFDGNLPRTGTKARVRCIRKAEGVTVK